MSRKKESAPTFKVSYNYLPSRDAEERLMRVFEMIFFDYPQEFSGPDLKEELLVSREEK